MISINDLSHQYGSETVLEGLNLQVEKGEIVCLLGASGSGKSTLLRIVAGLMPLQHGTVRIGDLPLITPRYELPPEKRRCGLVFQDHVLFPHMTVSENVAFGLYSKPADESRRLSEVRLREVGMDQHVDRYPHELSGGEQQRVALARALAPEPTVMLLDEPFANVDPTLRRRLREDTRHALKSSGIPSIIVTHDATEAMELGDRIAVLYDREIVQNAKPEDVWRHPANQFIAELMSETNAIAGIGLDDGIETRFGRIEKTGAAIEVNAPYVVIARPESISVHATTKGSVRVADVRFLGDKYVVTLETEGEFLRTTCVTTPDYSRGTAVSVDFNPANVIVYPEIDNESH
ncbi:MAG: ABC transporter ATP-binding protein [Gammaproteobacteria bacterium]|nr:ABC transporter ATP-binding protein [Gammaproteobacteria bacterium]